MSDLTAAVERHVLPGHLKYALLAADSDTAYVALTQHPGPVHTGAIE